MSPLHKIHAATFSDCGSYYTQGSVDAFLSPSSAAAVEDAPCVIPEQKLTLFKFYMNQSIQDGVTDGDKLYQLAKQFSIQERLEAFQFGCALIAQRVPAIISVSPYQHSVWISLRRS